MRIAHTGLMYLLIRSDPSFNLMRRFINLPLEQHNDVVREFYFYGTIPEWLFE